MSLRTVELHLDRHRLLKFDLASLRLCCRRLGGISFLQLLQRLEQLDLEALIQALHCGLTHEDKKLDLQEVERLAQIYMDREGSAMGLIAAVSEAIELSNMIRRRKADENGGAEGEGTRPDLRSIP